MSETVYNFDTCPDRAGYGSQKWDKYKGKDILLWVADMDFVSAPEIVSALQAASTMASLATLSPTKRPCRPS